MTRRDRLVNEEVGSINDVFEFVGVSYTCISRSVDLTNVWQTSKFVFGLSSFTDIKTMTYNGC